MKKNWTIFNGLLAVLISLMLMTGCSDDDHSTAGVESGKVIQGPVDGAKVFLDMNGNREWDQGEPYTTTDAKGNYTLNIPNGKEGLICTSGGSYKRNGKDVAALPLLAPRGAENITSLTTLVAINPDIKVLLGDEYDKNPYEKEMSSAALRLKIVAENYMKSFRDDLDKPAKDIFNGMVLLAKELAELKPAELSLDSKVTGAIDKAILGALKSSLVDDLSKEDFNKIKTGEDLAESDPVLGSVYNNITENLAYTVKAIDVEKTYDSDEIAGLEEKAEVLKIGFNPTTNFIPMPNDLAWAAYGEKVNLPIDPKGDPAQNALYTAINKLEISGLSPNTPIAIPFTSDKELDLDTAEIVIVNLTSYLTDQAMGKTVSPLDYLVTDYTKSQDENFLKIYPTKPLDSGAKYAVVLFKGLKSKSSEPEKVEVQSNSLFELLKTDLDKDLGNDSLEAIRLAYSKLFNLVPVVSVSESSNMTKTKDDILSLFTFTTAEKTLSTTDFASIQATLGSEGDPADMTIPGLDYAAVSGEYAKVNMFAGVKLLGKTAVELTAILSQMEIQASISSDISAMTSDQDSFESLNITSIAPFLMGGEPQYIDVPYVIYNQDKFGNNRQVIVFQHGFGGDKAHAQVIAQKFPDYTVIAMDLPYHGGRVSSADTASGGGFLTSNLPMNRINLYQSFYDMSVFVQGIKSGKFDINGDGALDYPENIYFIGQSLGSITGSVVANTSADRDTEGNPTTYHIDKAVLNTGGANFAAILDTAKNASLAGLVKSLGIEKNSPQYFVTLGVLQLIMDPCDPAYLAKDLTTNVEDTIFQFAYKDTVVSNVSNEIFANVAGAEAKVEVAEFSTPADFENNKAYVFGGKADKKDNWIPHGFLLSPGTDNYPEAKEFMDEDYISEASSAVGAWTKTYLDK